MSKGFFYGQIVRIRVARHGKEKLRPVVVVTPNESIAEGQPAGRRNLTNAANSSGLKTSR
jgi:hypothetical protein